MQGGISLRSIADMLLGWATAMHAYVSAGCLSQPHQHQGQPADSIITY